MNLEKNSLGFSPQNEQVFLARLEPQRRIRNLEQELKTQLAEDFGLVEFTIKYVFDDKNKIIDENSGQGIVELTDRGKVKEETVAIQLIEKGLSKNPNEMWVHFSPQNEDLGYASNCVDFWRVIDDRIVWNRIVVRENLEEMNRLRNELSGGERIFNRREILGQPVVTKLTMAEIFPLLELNRSQNKVSFEKIKDVVEKCLFDFRIEFGKELTGNSDLIFRLYSACYEAIKNKKFDFTKNNIHNFMYSQLSSRRQEVSFGCSVATTVGAFGEKIGYYINPNGEVKYGEIPPDYKHCKHCGCWYFGEKCPFC